MTTSSTKTHTVRTTTVVMEQPQDYRSLDARFRLVRYVLPDTLRRPNNPTNYGQMQNALRDQIDAPYKSFKYDRLNGPLQWAVYVLFPPDGPLPDVVLPWLSAIPLPKQQITFAVVPLHLLLKLLHIAFFRGTGVERFIGEDKCYVYAKSGTKDFHTCAEINIEGAPSNEEGDRTQEFRISAHAHCFAKVLQPRIGVRTYFGKRPVGNRFYFVHLRSQAIPHESTLYEIVTFRGKKTLLKYHDSHHLDASSGKIVANFIEQFLMYLTPLGITGQAKQRTFSPAPAPLSEQTVLPLQRLEIVGVYDNRLRREQPVEVYVDLLNGMRPDVTFVAIGTMLDAPGCGVLVLLDGTQEDFAEDNILAGIEDPYPPLYAKYPDVPKQSINVNPNDDEELEGGDYLDYPLVKPEDALFALKLDVALSELYLKCTIRYGLTPFPLPLLEDQRAYVRRRNYDGTKYTIALWHDHEQMSFADLGDPAQSTPFFAMLETWGVTWDTQYDQLLAEHHRLNPDGTMNNDLPQFEIIVGPDLFVAIDNLNERPLYDYQEIARRHTQHITPLPIDDLRLLPYYDQVKGSAMLTLATLKQRGLLTGDRPTEKQVEQQSRTFYRQLEAYDALLDEVAQVHPQISYDELTSGEWLERIARIFGSKPNKKGEYQRNLIASLYKHREMFLSEKGHDVQMYQGIWHDQSGAFVVGSPFGMDIHGQQRAHLIRRFQVLQGSTHFDPDLLLRAAGVFFVRPRQFTVVPYYFHLIDVYAENTLRYLAPYVSKP